MDQATVERERRRDDRERDMIEMLGDLALLAPSPELLKEVIALEVPEADRPARVAIPVDEPVAGRAGI
jgi:hypothetical protein